MFAAAFKRSKKCAPVASLEWLPKAAEARDHVAIAIINANKNKWGLADEFSCWLMAALARLSGIQERVLFSAHEGMYSYATPGGAANPFLYFAPPTPRACRLGLGLYDDTLVRRKYAADLDHESNPLNCHFGLTEAVKQLIITVINEGLAKGFVLRGKLVGVLRFLIGLGNTADFFETCLLILDACFSGTFGVGVEFVMWLIHQRKETELMQYIRDELRGPERGSAYVAAWFRQQAVAKEVLALGDKACAGQQLKAKSNIQIKGRAVVMEKVGCEVQAETSITGLSLSLSGGRGGESLDIRATVRVAAELSGRLEFGLAGDFKVRVTVRFQPLEEVDVRAGEKIGAAAGERVVDEVCRESGRQCAPEVASNVVAQFAEQVGAQAAALVYACAIFKNDASVSADLLARGAVEIAREVSEKLVKYVRTGLRKETERRIATKISKQIQAEVRKTFGIPFGARVGLVVGARSTEESAIVDETCSLAVGVVPLVRARVRFASDVTCSIPLLAAGDATRFTEDVVRYTATLAELKISAEANAKNRQVYETLEKLRDKELTIVTSTTMEPIPERIPRGQAHRFIGTRHDKTATVGTPRLGLEFTRGLVEAWQCEDEGAAEAVFRGQKGCSPACSEPLVPALRRFFGPAAKRAGGELLVAPKCSDVRLVEPTDEQVERALEQWTSGNKLEGAKKEKWSIRRWVQQIFVRVGAKLPETAKAGSCVFRLTKFERAIDHFQNMVVLEGDIYSSYLLNALPETVEVDACIAAIDALVEERRGVV
jgi:hypothetical protein